MSIYEQKLSSLRPYINEFDILPRRFPFINFKIA